MTGGHGAGDREPRRVTRTDRRSRRPAGTGRRRTRSRSVGGGSAPVTRSATESEDRFLAMGPNERGLHALGRRAGLRARPSQRDRAGSRRGHVSPEPMSLLPPAVCSNPMGRWMSPRTNRSTSKKKKIDGFSRRRRIAAQSPRSIASRASVMVGCVDVPPIPRVRERTRGFPISGVYPQRLAAEEPGQEPGVERVARAGAIERRVGRAVRQRIARLRCSHRTLTGGLDDDRFGAQQAPVGPMASSTTEMWARLGLARPRSAEAVDLRAPMQQNHCAGWVPVQIKRAWCLPRPAPHQTFGQFRRGRALVAGSTSWGRRRRVRLRGSVVDDQPATS